MTYRELLNSLSKLTDDQLDHMDVTVFVDGEFRPIVKLDETGDDADILDPHHPFLSGSVFALYNSTDKYERGVKATEKIK
jgi:hypothetical protein